jgi:hypothetical protein
MLKPRTPLAVGPATLTLPLTAEQRAAYQNLYNQFETAIENTTDVNILESLNASQLAVETVLSQDAQQGLANDTALCSALIAQIKTTNDGLASLKTQIQAISSGISTFSDIVAGITKVLNVIPGV